MQVKAGGQEGEAGGRKRLRPAGRRGRREWRVARGEKFGARRVGDSTHSIPCRFVSTCPRPG
eukprot:3744494-Prymnesium_polylepis.1